MKISTTCVQGGYTPGNGEPRQIPIIQSTTFKYENSEQMARLFDLEDEGYFYTRPVKIWENYLIWRPAAIFTHGCKTLPTTLWLPKSHRWKAELPPCSPAADRLPTFSHYLTSASAGITSYLPAPFTAEPTTLLPSP